MSLQACRVRLAKLDAALDAQRRFIHRVPDPDTRERAEHHLYRLSDMRNEVAATYADLEAAETPSAA